jgi:hypothetical protein
MAAGSPFHRAALPEPNPDAAAAGARAHGGRSGASTPPLRVSANGMEASAVSTDQADKELPEPVQVQVASRSRKTSAASGRGKLTVGVIGMFHPQVSVLCVRHAVLGLLRCTPRRAGFVSLGQGMSAGRAVGASL